MTLLTVYQVAKILKVTPRTVRNLIKSGELNAGKIGREWRISEDELIRYVTSVVNKATVN